MTTAVLVLARTLHIGSAMLLVAFPYFMLIVARSRLIVDRGGDYALFFRNCMRWLGGAWVMEAISGFVWFWFVTAEMSDESPWSILASSELSTVLWQTQFGQLWAMRAVFGFAFGVMIYLMSRRKTGFSSGASLLDWLVWGVSGVLLVTLAWSGHASAGVRFHVLQLAVDILHLLIGAIWPASLIPLLYFLWHVHSGDRMVASDREIKILERFSQISLLAVLVLVVTGTINGWLMVGSWEGLVTTTYGRLLLGKILVVGVMIGLGAINRLLILPRLKTESALFQTLRRTILAESGLALVVLLIVGIMGMTAPPS